MRYFLRFTSAREDGKLLISKAFLVGRAAREVCTGQVFLVSFRADRVMSLLG